MLKFVGLFEMLEWFWWTHEVKTFRFGTVFGNLKWPNCLKWSLDYVLLSKMGHHIIQSVLLWKSASDASSVLGLGVAVLVFQISPLSWNLWAERYSPSRCPHWLAPPSQALSIKTCSELLVQRWCRIGYPRHSELETVQANLELISVCN